MGDVDTRWGSCGYTLFERCGIAVRTLVLSWGILYRVVFVKIGALLAASILLLSGQVNAALIEQDLFSIGDGLTTLDSMTGLQWLDVTETVGLSYGDVLISQYITDLSFRYASLQELTSLFDNAGGSGDYLVPRNSNGDYKGVPVAENYDAAMLLISLMGCTSYLVGQACDSDDQDWHIGMYGEQVVNGVQNAAAVNAFNNSPLYGNAGAIWLDAAESVPGRTTIDFGSYLVRINPVPVPGAIWLFGTGPLGLIGFSKRRKAAGRAHG
jgi:hypothetical protein